MKACNRCDLLLHEAYSDASFLSYTPERQRYFRSFHTSSAELAKEATQAEPRLLVLYHQMHGGGVTYDQLLGEVMRQYTGNVASARDLDVY